ncbi:MAG: TonB family protein [Sphingomonadaceae bacterium]
MIHSIKFGAALLALATAAAPAAAGPGDDFDRWLTREIEQRMASAHVRPGAYGAGATTLSFRPGADGRAADIVIVESSGDRRHDEAAREIVQKLRDLPAMAPPGPHLVVLQFGDEREMRGALAYRRAMNRAEQTALAMIETGERFVDRGADRGGMES